MNCEQGMSFFAYVSRLMRSKRVRALSRRRRECGFPRVACFPGDDIGDQIIAHGRYEDLLLDLLFRKLLLPLKERFSAGVALDIGANIGNHTIFFSQIFSGVCSFEPSPVASRLLEASVLMNGIANVSVSRVALSDRVGTAEFFSNQHANLGRSGLSSHLKDDAAQRYVVDVAMGDEVVPSCLNGRPIELVKVDVEGHELPVLVGMRELLSKHRPIVLFEYHMELNSGATPLDELRDLGYEHFYVVERNSNLSGNLIGKLLYRLFNGSRLKVVRFDPAAKSRSYDVVVASCQDLLSRTWRSEVACEK